MGKQLTLIIDSREQDPLSFRDGVFDSQRVEGMPVGDYWAELDGKEVPLCFERKGFGDLFSTLTSGHKRFKREIIRAQEMGMTVILLIEGSMREVARGFKYSSVKGDTILKMLAMLRVRHDIEYHFCNDRREMARFIEEMFSAVKRNYKKESTKEPKCTAQDVG